MCATPYFVHILLTKILYSTKIKIIPFETKKRQKSDFRLKAEISIYICKNGKKYTCNVSSPNKDMDIEEIVCIFEKYKIDAGFRHDF